MARRRNPPELVRTKWQLADRIRSVRTELYGERGLAELAKQIGVPVRTWYSYETGVTVPAEVLLRFIELTHAEPLWLLHGSGNKYQSGHLAPADERLFGEPDSAQEEWLSVGVSDGDEGFVGRFEVEYPAEPGGLEPQFQSATAVAVAEAASQAIGRAMGAPAGAPLSVRRCFECLRMEGDSMLPIIAPGAYIAFSDEAETPGALEGKMVVARLGDRRMVRWFHRSGRYALLRAENATFEPRTELVDLDSDPEETFIRRVLWIGTSH